MDNSANKRKFRKAVERLLRRMADAVGRLDAESDDLAKLASGGFTVEIVFDDESARSSHQKKTAKRPRVEPDYDLLKKRLMSVHSLLEGEGILAELSLTRGDLETLSRQLELPVTRTDRVEQLRQGILDATIGYRLRSQAIRGNQGPS